MEHPSILKVDRAFNPDKWVGREEAVGLYSRGLVMTSLGDTVLRLRGGTNARTGRQSFLDVSSIIVVDSKENLVTDFAYAPYSRALLMRMNRYLCQYCGQRFKERDLTMDHIIPRSQGGKVEWYNAASACRRCNSAKGPRNPEQAGMPLLFLPYRPSRFEWLILSGRNILGDQLSFIENRLPRHSRLLH